MNNLNTFMVVKICIMNVNNCACECVCVRAHTRIYFPAY